jgi:hypothetical protein
VKKKKIKMDFFELRMAQKSKLEFVKNKKNPNLNLLVG